MTSLFEWVQRYIRMGWPVIPLNGKIPRTANGSKDATLNEAQAAAWWKMWPNANIGLATGHGWFAFDLDIKDGGEDSYDFLRHQHGPFPETVEQVTGTGGRHKLFRSPAEFVVRNSKGKLAPGIDIRGQGGYIVAAPSIHPDTGRAYDWDGTAEIEDTPIATAPAWLLSWLKGQSTGQLAGAPGFKADPIAPALIKGTRHAALVRIAGGMRRNGLSAAEIFPGLQVINANRCDPPYDEQHIRQIAESMEKYSPDARFNLFKSAAGPAPDDKCDEIPVSGADVEAAIDEMVARNDLIGAVRLAPEIAKLRPMMQAVIVVKLRKQFGREFPAREFERALKDAAPAGGDVPPEDPPGAASEPLSDGAPELRYFPLTDSGNGERIAALFGHEIRYCTEMKKWIVWDGKRWAVDAMNVMRQRGKKTARTLYTQAVGNSSIERHARDSESYSAISSALGQAATEKGVPVSVDDLDQQAYLLNCPNGVVDLRTGDLMPHKREFLLTKLCPVPYDPAARCPRFLTFIAWAMGGNPEAELTERTVRLVGFLQRAFGYALTSDVSEKAVFILHGERGNNGKTTLLTLFRELLGRDYSGQLVIDTVMTMKNQDATTRADLADLRGVRLVVTSEVEKEHKLNEGKIKYITAGMGSIKSCRKYENPIEFQATHKLFMDCNHRPTVRGVDDAIWRRLKLIPFNVTVSEEEKDLQLPDKLRAEMPGILAWAVRGCMAWKKGGLGDPPEVAEAGADWREHDDPLKDFLDDCCDADNPDLFIRASDLAAGYEWWAKQNRERYPLGREGFNERLQAKGFRQNRGRRIDGKQARTWEGIQLKPEVSSAAARHGKSAAWLAEDKD